MGFVEKKVQKFLEKNLLLSSFYQRNTARRISRITVFASFMIKIIIHWLMECCGTLVAKKILDTKFFLREIPKILDSSLERLPRF